MKTRMMLLALLVASTMAYAQKPATRDLASYFAIDRGPNAISFDTGVRNLVWCLSHECEGVVKSAMAHLVRLRVAHPEIALPKAEKAIRKMVFEGESSSVRYEAYLAIAVFENPGMIDLSVCNPDYSPEMLFAVVADKLQESSFGKTPIALSAYGR